MGFRIKINGLGPLIVKRLLKSLKYRYLSDFFFIFIIMRRKEKLLHITKLNNKLNESKFSWDGKYANEDDSITEHHSGEYGEKIMNMTISEFLDALSTKDKMAYDIVEKVIEKHFNETTDEGTVSFGDDIELKEGDCDCSVNESEPTDVENSTWFSDTDGERLTDKCMDC